MRYNIDDINKYQSCIFKIESLWVEYRNINSNYYNKHSINYKNVRIKLISFKYTQGVKPLEVNSFQEISIQN